VVGDVAFDACPKVLFNFPERFADLMILCIYCLANPVVKQLFDRLGFFLLRSPSPFSRMLAI
jgi:hypothetical protein